jgi:hypothetical protein
MCKLLSQLLIAVMASAAPEPKLVRVAIVDNSGSMSGARSATVRKELTSIIHQLPPSPEFPLLLLVFDEKVAPTQLITDLPTAEKAVLTLQGNGGGTRIALGLMRACEELKKFEHGASALVLLYTDGEDDDQESIRRAENQLDAIFSQRGRQGLESNVYVKRWGNANAELISRLRAGGHVRVLDAGELAVEPLTVTPEVKVIETRRDPQNPRELHVTYTPTLIQKGNPLSGKRLTATFECQSPGVAGQIRAQVQPDSKPSQFALTVPVPTDETNAHSLLFQVTISASSDSASTFVLPILSTSKIVVPIAIPSLTVHRRLAAEIRAAKVVGWADPEKLLTRCQFELAVTVAAPSQTTIASESTPFEIIPDGPIRILGGTDTAQLHGPGTYPISVALEAPVDAGNPKSSGHTLPISFVVQPRQNTANVVYDPPQMHLQHVGLELPKPVVTVVTPLVQRIGKPVWVDLVEPLAAFDADVLFRVAGPIPYRTNLTLVAPGNVQGNLIPRGTFLHSGESTVTLHVVARLGPGKRERLDFAIMAPPATPAIEFQIASGFSLSLTAPPTAAIAAVDQGSVHKVMAVSAADNQDSIDLNFTPALIGVDYRQLRRLPRVVARSDSSASIVGDHLSPLLRRWPLRLRLTPLAPQPFFQDSQQTVNLELHPEPNSPAVAAGRLQVIVTRQAPFKRLLLYLAWAAFPVGILALAAQVIRRLREGISK